MSTRRSNRRREDPLERHLAASLDTTCPECRGTLQLRGQGHAAHRGRLTLQQEMQCLHCAAAFTRILPVPQPNPLWQPLTRAAKLAFTSARVQITRAAKALGLLTR